MRRLPVLALVLIAVPVAAQQPTAQVATPAGPLTLEEAMRWARSQGVTASVARLNSGIAETRIGQKRADLLPRIDGGLTYTRQTLNLDEFGFPGVTGVTDPFDLYRARLGATQPLVDLAALSRVAGAKDSLKAAGNDAMAVGSVAAANAGAAYVRHLAAVATVAAREADSAIAGDLLRQAQELADAGVSPEIDVTRNSVNLSTVRTQLVLARNAREGSRIDLLRALSLPLETPLVLADTLGQEDTALPVDEDSAVALAMTQRPEVVAERQRTHAAELNRRAVGRENLPMALASGMVQESGQHLNNMAASWNVQVGVAVPILDGFRRQKRREEQAIRVDAQKLRERDVTQQVDADARRAVLDLRSAREQVDVAQQRLELAQRELEQAEERVAAGVAGSVETSNAQRNLVLARDAQILARLSLDLARIEAYQALGLIVTPAGN